MKRKLLALILLVCSGCNSYNITQYEIGDKPTISKLYNVGTSQVRLYKYRDGIYRLVEYKEDGSKIIYYDYGNDGNVDSVIISNGKTREYSKFKDSQTDKVELYQLDFERLMKDLRDRVEEDNLNKRNYFWERYLR